MRIVAGAGARSLWPHRKAPAGYPDIPESSRDKGKQTKDAVQGRWAPPVQ